jgi:hypothetical protein
MRIISSVFLFVLFVLSSYSIITSSQLLQKNIFASKSVIENEQSEEDSTEKITADNFDEDIDLHSSEKYRLKRQLREIFDYSHYSCKHIASHFPDLGVYSPPENFLV